MLVPRLGAHPDDRGASFGVFSRGDAVELCLVSGGEERRIALTERTHDVWHGYVEGLAPGDRYGYRVAGAWDPGHGHRFDPAQRLVDPYARALSGGWSVVIDPTFDWAGDRSPQVPWADTVVYELHVRGFTRCHPAVPAPLRGTYAGLAHPEVIGHLLDLGVTTVELLPVHEFVSEPALARRGRANYWGYNTLGFFAPHAGYSAGGHRGQQVDEFKAMVRDLHRAGLEVVLDVVYNHTAEGDADGPTLSFRGLDNEAYYRLRRDGSYDDTTGCGNSLDLRHPRVLAMVTDSLRYWVQEMHVDGFRFDLAPTLARGRGGSFESASAFLSAVGQDPVLSRVKLIAEPWDVGPEGYQVGSFPAPWAEWNDRFRDSVRASWLGGRGHPHGTLRDLAFRLAGSSDIFGARSPLASVNFVTAHDGFTLHDLVSYDHKHNDANGEGGRDGSDDNRSWNCGVEGSTSDREVLGLRGRLMRNLLASLLVSTGVPMLTAGDETGRTQQGNNNPYCLDDETTWVSWEHQPWQRDLYDWTRALLTLRRDHRVLRHDAFFDGRPAHDGGRKDLAWFGPDGAEMSPEHWHDHRQVLGMFLAGRAGPEDSSGGSQALLVVLNTGPGQEVLRLPGPPWARTYTTLLDTADERPVAGATHDAGVALTVGPCTIQVLVAEE